LLLLKQVQNQDDLGQNFGHGLFEAEVHYLLNEEWAKSAEDILWRRSKLGLYFSPEQVAALENFVRLHGQAQTVS